MTAAHVVEGAVGVKVRDPGKVMHEAALDPVFVGDVNGPRPDLALVEITGPWIDVPAMGLAAVDRDSVNADPVERCHAVGYPAFMERQTAAGNPFRESVDAFGHVPVLSLLATGLLSVQLSSAPRPLPPEQTRLGESEWSGMSGGPVVANGLLLGVVTEHAPREGDSAVTATPLTALEADPAHPGWGPGVPNAAQWWGRLGISGLKELRRLPPPPVKRPEPLYLATIREIHRRTPQLLGRGRDLADLADFATGTVGYQWLVGGAWAGKTALLTEMVTAAVPPSVDVVAFFLSRREGQADSNRFLAAVVPQLAFLLDEDAPVPDLHAFRALWQRAAETAAGADRHLLLVVDGLDEDLRPPGSPGVVALLPQVAGGHAHVLVGSRPHLELRRDLPPGHLLADAQPVQLEPFEGGQEMAELARQETDDLLRLADDGLAADVLGLLTAAAGPLAVADLAAMTVVAPQSAALTRRIRGLVTAEAARSLQPVGLAKGDRYQFAHGSLLEQAQEDEDLNDPEFLDRLHEWADSWRAGGWPSADGSGKGTPRYLLDTYPSILAGNPQRLATLVSDAGWIETAIQSVGVDNVLADLRRAAANTDSTTVAAMLAAVRGQARYLRPPQPMDQPSYVLRQLCLQAGELSEDSLADDLRGRLQSRSGPCLVPLWTTRWASHALSAELGHHRSAMAAMAVLPDGHVVTGGQDGRVLVWDPAAPGTGPVELGRHHDPEPGRVDSQVGAVAVLPDGRVVTGGRDGRVLVWDPAAPGVGPAELGRHDGAVLAVAVLPDGRVVAGGYDGWVLAWNLATPGTSAAKLGRYNNAVMAVAMLPDRRVVTRGRDGRVLVWDPAAAASAGPTELGRHDDRMMAAAMLPDRRVVTGCEDGRGAGLGPGRPHHRPSRTGPPRRPGASRGGSAR